MAKSMTDQQFDVILKPIVLDEKGEADIYGVKELGNIIVQFKGEDFSHQQLDKLYKIIGFELQLKGNKDTKYWVIRNAIFSRTRAFHLANGI